MSVTRLKDGQSMVISEFDTREELIQVSQHSFPAKSVFFVNVSIRPFLPLALCQYTQGFYLQNTKDQELRGDGPNIWPDDPRQPNIEDDILSVNDCGQWIDGMR